METHPLNLAHQQHRRAEALLKCHRYDEAVQCHHNAAELLLDAMKSTSSSVALESITLQHSYHLKQKDLIRNKKEQFARVKKAIDHLKALSKYPTLDIQCNDNAKVEVAIYKTINETDSLLGMLTNTNHFDENTNNDGKDAIDGKVVEKKQETVVEELQILNHNLHSLIEKLVLQIEVLKDENTTLKERVNYLEKERNKYLNSQVAEYIENSNFNNLSLDVDSSIAGPTTKIYNNITKVLRPQQPHFDLSAFRDD